MATRAGATIARKWKAESSQRSRHGAVTSGWRLLRAARVPCGPVNDVARALTDVQVQARDMVVEIGHPEGGSFRATGNPIKLSETPGDTYDPPPLVGQHTDEVLAALCGKSDAELARLRGARVIA